MSQIRAMVPQDIERVAALYDTVVRSGAGEPPRGLVDYFRRTLIDHPFYEPEIPSLVYEGPDGQILGFLGSHVRRAVLDDRPIRIGCSGQLVRDPSRGSPGIGALLMRRYLAGAQELTLTDGATPLVAEMWTRLGGFLVHPSSFVWTRVLRPARTAGELLAGRSGRTGLPRGTSPILTSIDALAGRLTRPAAPDGALQTVELTAEAMVEHGPMLAGGARLRRALDPESAGWLIGELTAVRTRGRLARRLVRRNGRPVGWYLAYHRRGGASQALDVRALPGEIDGVFDLLVADCWRVGSTSVEGRVDPWLFETVARRRLPVRAGERVLYHSRLPEIERLVATGDSNLSRLDGEWWMGHHTESFD